MFEALLIFIIVAITASGLEARDQSARHVANEDARIANEIDHFNATSLTHGSYDDRTDTTAGVDSMPIFW